MSVSSMLEMSRFQAAFRSAAAGSAIATPDGVLVEVNDTYAALVGRSVKELVGTRVAALTHPEDLAETAAYFRRALQGGTARDQLEKRFVRPDGTSVPVLVSAALVYDEEDRPAYVVAQVIDLSARHAAEEAVRSARQRQSLILASLPGTVVALYDDQLCVLETEGIPADDPEGHTDASVRGAHLSSFLPAQAFAAVEPAMVAALAGGRGHATTSSFDGREFEVETAPFVENDRITGALAVWRDVTSRNVAERQRREADLQLRTAFDHAPIGMVMVGLDGRFTRCNDAICQITGRTSQELIALAPFAFVHTDDLPEVTAAFADLGQKIDTLSLEHRIVHADGHAVWVQAQITVMRSEDDQPLYALAQVTDVSERKVFEERLQHMADHDPLTGLLNRRSFQAALAAHLRAETSGALVVLDVDQFKLVNDTHGHGAGDDLLVRVAAALGGVTRDCDLLARIGGDEFAILLTTGDAAEAQAVAARLLNAVRREPLLRSGLQGQPVTLSVGIRAIAQREHGTAEELLVQADLAMYDAKKAGRDRAALAADTRPSPAPPTRLGWRQQITAAVERRAQRTTPSSRS
jgi:diguanylate cyclase (GGDEF)-like protein/PAS domain S-box-containing protein